MKGSSAKTRTHFVCQACGAQEPRWAGRCRGCNAWNTMLETEVAPAAPRGLTSAGPAVATHAPRAAKSGALHSRPIGEVQEGEGTGRRLHSGMAAVDRVLGGGLVVGSLVLLGGDPGIGKSTMLLQVFHQLGENNPDLKMLYVSGEEAVGQVALRARRLQTMAKGLHVMAETRLSAILSEAERLGPAVLAVDSIQTVQVEGVESVPGSLTQVREAALRLMTFAKSNEVATVLVGHMTKDGSLAGPKTLEHLVDTVLLFEGERGYPYRVLRGSKNRFGATSELGVFEMHEDGLREIVDPSKLFLAERPRGVPGSAVVAAISGSMPVLLELQALTAHAVTVPRRTVLGIDPNRVAMLLAVLERRGGIDILAQDVFINVAGGMHVDETAADLAVVAALASSSMRRPVDPGAVCFGEVGLAGEVRAVSQPQARVDEARKLGFQTCVLPQASVKQLKAGGASAPRIIGVRDIGQAIEALLQV